MSQLVFKKCSVCGNIVRMVEDHKVPVMCCGKPMDTLKANSTDAATEKHVPVVTVDGNKLHVVVGDVIHPATEEHHISWIYVETEKGGQMKYLEHTATPEATFDVTDDKPLRVYEYCNLHGLWVKEL